MRKFLLITLVIFSISATTSTMNTDSAGRHVSTGSTPVISACGTSPSVIGNDEAGQITIGSGGIATSCTLTFASAWTTAPICLVNHQGAIVAARAVTTTTTLVIDTVLALTASGKIDYICRGR